METSVNIYSEKFIKYVKLVLIAILVITEIMVCAQTAIRSTGGKALAINLTVVSVCCFLLAVVETIDSFVIKNFTLKMVFYGIDAALLLVICMFTGNSLLAALYCVVLTQIYMNVERFRDKFILFMVSCALFTISFVLGWVFTNAGASTINSTVEIASGTLFGLLAIALDFIIVQFLLSFYKKNKELSAALKEADESRAALKEASKQLSETAVFEERNRIAKDIHDNAGHSMTTVIMQTEAAKLLIDKDPEEAKNRIISANIQARNALEQMRESVHLLAGREKTLTLREEMEGIIAQTIDGTDIKARYDIDDAAPDGRVCRFLCNSLKECLANGIRHGRATAFYIELKNGVDGLVFYISDNGTGVDGKVNAGFGLSGILEGARSLGGACRFTSVKGEGFEVTVNLPAAEGQKLNTSAQNEVKND